MDFQLNKKLVFFIIILFSQILFSKEIKVGIYLKQRRVFVSSNSRIYVYRGNHKVATIYPNARVFFWIKSSNRFKRKKKTKWYIQVGAFKRNKSLKKCINKISELTNISPEIKKSKNGIHIVRIGPFDSLSDASTLKDSIRLIGFSDAFLLSKDGKNRRSRIYLIDSDYNKRYISSSAITLKSKGLIKVNRSRYRGEILIIPYLGRLNVVNKLDVEDYLKGVVPAEMSPKLYPDIEALKAQAVAARTYVYYNLKQFKSMGFDICASQSCQVYKGYDVENDMSNEAVDETKGEIIVYNGKPINAMFTAYCGGHTEDFEKIFGGVKVPYLRGVKCEGEGSFPHKTISALKTLESTSSPYVSRPYLAISVLLSKGILKKSDLVGLNNYADKAFAVNFFNRLFDYLGIKEENIPLKSVKLTDIGEYLAIHIFNSESLKPLFESKLILQDLPDTKAKRIDLIAIAYSLLKEFDGIDYYNLDFMVIDRDFLLNLENPEFIFLNQGNVEIPVPVATVRIGDRIRLIYDKNNVPLSLIIVTPESQYGINDSFLSNYEWYVFLNKEKLQNRAKKFGFNRCITDIKVLEKTDTGRVVKIKVKSGKYYKIYSGLKVRWFFGVKENKFKLFKRFDKNGDLNGVYLVGNAWGHGVGMCQIGAFGLATKGWDYKRILKHYYTGVKIKKVK